MNFEINANLTSTEIGDFLMVELEDAMYVYQEKLEEAKFNKEFYENRISMIQSLMEILQVK